MSTWNPQRDTLYLTVPSDHGPRVVNVRFLPNGHFVATARDDQGHVTAAQGQALLEQVGVKFYPVTLGDRTSYQIRFEREGMYGVHTQQGGEGGWLGVGQQGRAALNAQPTPPERQVSASVRISEAEMRDPNHPGFYRLLWVRGAGVDALPVDLNLAAALGRGGGRYNTGHGYTIRREGDHFQIDFTDAQAHRLYVFDRSTNRFVTPASQPTAH